MYPYRCGAAAVLTLTTVASMHVLGTLPGCTHSMCVCVCVCVCVCERERERERERAGTRWAESVFAE